MKYKPGDKFIIEIEYVDATGINRLKSGGYVANETLDDLERYDEIKERLELIDELKQAEYQRGLDDAWKTVKTMYRSITVEELRKMFPIAKTKSHYWIADAIMDEYTAAEAIAKIHAYEETQEIKVGDEVKFIEAPWVVTSINTVIGEAFGISQRGNFVSGNLQDLTKTGRHFPEVATLLEKLKEDAPDV